MTSPLSKPGLTERALHDREKRLEREAAALRANLHKRKAQVRNRPAKAPQDHDPDDDASPKTSDLT